MQSFSWWLPCCSVRGSVSEKLNGQRLIKTTDAPPPLFPTRHPKNSFIPAIPRSLPHPVEFKQGGLVLVSSLFHLRFILSCPLLLFEWRSVLGYSNSLPPRLPASLWTEGHAVYEQHADRQENKPHVTSPCSVTLAVGVIVSQSNTSPPEMVLFFKIYSHKYLVISQHFNTTPLSHIQSQSELSSVVSFGSPSCATAQSICSFYWRDCEQWSPAKPETIHHYNTERERESTTLCPLRGIWLMVNEKNLLFPLPNNKRRKKQVLSISLVPAERGASVLVSFLC